MNSKQMQKEQYDHYIAVDWSRVNMAIARMTKKSNKITVIDVPPDVGDFRAYLEKLEGSKVLVIEETTTSQWLYAELSPYVDRIIICDPHRNRLLSEGPKTDKIDASKLVQLLRAGLLKEIYHSSEKFLHLRTMISGYEDLVKVGVGLKNQRSALLRGCGKTGHEKAGLKLENSYNQFVLECLERQIKSYEEEKDKYKEEFKGLAKKHAEIRHQTTLPGIGDVGAVKIVSRVVTPFRFADIGHYLSYAGLVKLDRVSGGKSYGLKSSRYCRQLKSVYKTGVFAAIGSKNCINDYYEALMRDKNYPEYMARHKACRRLAALSLGVFKSKKRFQNRRETNVDKQTSKQ